jgi:hypothetical protein
MIALLAFPSGGRRLGSVPTVVRSTSKTFPANRRSIMSDQDQLSSAAPDDEPSGDSADQAQRLRAVEERAAIGSALGEDVDSDHEVIDPAYLARLTADDDLED